MDIYITNDYVLHWISQKLHQLMNVRGSSDQIL